MRTKAFLTGIFRMALVFGMVFLGGCPQDTPPDITQYTVTFSTGEGGGSPPEPKKADEGSSITLPGQGSMTAPTDKEFDGWKADGVAYTAGSSYTVKGNITIIASWKAKTQNTPAAPAGMKVSIRHFAQDYQDEVISKITIYKYDDTKTNNLGDVYQSEPSVTIKYTDTWGDGLIKANGKYVVEVVIGANAYTYRYTLEVFEASGTTILSYNGEGLVKQ